jgi:predicted DNA-binding transcriptional regulator AlpA
VVVIPRGRPVVDAVEAAQLLGKSVKTFRNAISGSHGFPAPVNPGRRKLLYDREQVQAYRDMRPLPELPPAGHDDDLLDEHDTAQLLGVKDATVRKDRDVGRLPEPVKVGGVVHWRRSVIAAVPASRPGRGVGGGRPRKNPTPDLEDQ